MEGLSDYTKCNDLSSPLRYRYQYKRKEDYSFRANKGLSLVAVPAILVFN